ncbi:restriction endonuclease subunit S [Flavimarina sp. Hel_I_48]|uniref:restriction endonuclease subunit S n=1 Tax=Flavimarina sp. Hel_I_48 TaxID=1392488 RepID=UPI0004DFC25D|nr:restriction endonuclease subunit S [Flavimarina sp. Hel_I_48]
MVTLSNYIEIVGGGTPSKNNESYWNGNIPWVSVKDLKEEFLNSSKDYITEEGLKNSSSKLIVKDTLLIATRMAIGKVTFAKIDVAINQDLKAIYCKSGLDKKYLFYFLKSKKDYFESVSSGATVKGIKLNHISDISLTLPPLKTQQKIAAILDEADKLRQLDKQLLKKYEDLGQSLFLDMFGDPGSNKKCWKYVSLEKVIVDGPTNGLYKPSKDYGSGNLIIRIDAFNNDYIDTTALKRVRVSKTELKRYLIKPGDFVINRVNSPSHLGKCGLVQDISEEIVYESNMMRVAFNQNKVNNQYMLMILSSKFMKNQILSSSKDAVNQSSINQKDVKSFVIPIPPIEIQNKYGNILNEIDKEKKIVDNSLKESENLFNSLLQKAFKGELV